MSEETADALLTEARTLRDRARADRRAYWLPLLFFGLAIAGSAPLFVERTESGDINPTGSALYTVTTDPRLRPYWTVVLLGGALLTAWWYRRHGSRTGIEGRVGPPLVAATLFLIGYAVLGLLPFAPRILWPLWQHDLTALLVIAVGLLALSWQERSRKLGVIAGLFTASAVLANTYDVQDIAFRLGWDPFADQVRFEQLPALVLPAVVLLGGALVAAPWSRRAG